MTRSSSKASSIIAIEQLKNEQPGKIPPFILKLFHMVESCNDEHPDSMCWSEEGDAVVVKNSVFLQDKIIPQYFNTSKFSSLNRQLNFYGFKKSLADPGTDGFPMNKLFYCHRYFRKNRSDLLPRIKRSTAGVSQEVLSQDLNYLENDLESFQEELESVKKSLDTSMLVFSSNFDKKLKEAEKRLNSLSVKPKKEAKTTPNPIPYIRMDSFKKFIGDELKPNLCSTGLARMHSLGTIEAEPEMKENRSIRCTSDNGVVSTADISVLPGGFTKENISKKYHYEPMRCTSDDSATYFLGQSLLSEPCHDQIQNVEPIKCDLPPPLKKKPKRGVSDDEFLTFLCHNPSALGIRRKISRQLSRQSSADSFIADMIRHVSKSQCFQRTDPEHYLQFQGCTTGSNETCLHDKCTSSENKNAEPGGKKRSELGISDEDFLNFMKRPSKLSRKRRRSSADSFISGIIEQVSSPNTRMNSIISGQKETSSVGLIRKHAELNISFESWISSLLDKDGIAVEEDTSNRQDHAS